MRERIFRVLSFLCGAYHPRALWDAGSRGLLENPSMQEVGNNYTSAGDFPETFELSSISPTARSARVAASSPPQ